MPRLSLWRNNKTNDYKFFDRRISEMFTVGGTDVNIHKYLGPVTDTPDGDATQPSYTNQSEQNIQDLLFTENRDRKYDHDVYTLRGVYTVTDLDFDLTQFGLFLANDTIFITFHYNNMIETLGRKIIAGDVIELPHLTDYHPLDEDVPEALKRYYVVQDAARASEGYSATWFSHLWRIKCTPLVDSQEYKDILQNVKSDELDGDSSPIGDLLSLYNQNIDINDAIIEEAENQVAESGYDTSTFYTNPVDEDGTPADPDVAPVKAAEGYLTGDGLAPNGFAAPQMVSFPSEPSVGDYVLRIDYFPSRLFRYGGSRWTYVEEDLRTPLTNGADNETQRSSFVNNTNTFTDETGTTHDERQSLSEALTPKADN